MKICKVCKSDSNPFEPNRHTCRVCRSEYKVSNTRSKEGHIKKIHRNQKRVRTQEYTLEELTQWCLAQEIFHKLYKDWADSGYNKYLAPSINRIDNSMGYNFNNIEIMTWKENDVLGHEHCKLGLIYSGNKNIEVEQYTLDGEYIREYPTVNRASIALGKSCAKEILKCCRGEFKQAQGFIWKFKEV